MTENEQFIALFVGEKRSTRAIKMNYTLRDGRLAGKQLFDALEYCGISPSKQEFCNWFEKGGKIKVKEWKGIIIAMGNKVGRELTDRKITHIKIIHPAARGIIRKKENYFNHIKTILYGQRGYSSNTNNENLRISTKIQLL